MSGSHALLVGIDRYPGFGPGAQLEGAVNDIRAFAAILQQRWGLRPGEISLLLEEHATRAAILAAFERVIDRLCRGDRVYFYFSGHGSQMTDREGDEGDGLDETLVPCDSGRGRQQNRDISDDEIHLWVSRVLEKTTDLVLIFDCCHAATLHRPRWRVRSVPADLRPIHRLPPSPVGVRREIRGPESAVVLSACGDRQLAYELPAAVAGEARGAFSFHLGQALLTAGPEKSWRELLAHVQTKVKKQCRDQEPVLSGAGIDAAIGRRDVSHRGDPLLARAAFEYSRLAEENEAWTLTILRARRGPWRLLDEHGFTEGDRMRVDVRHSEVGSRFFYVLDLGVTGRVSQIFPEPNGHEALDPGLTISVGARPESDYELFWPAEAPVDLLEARCQLILVASARRLDHRALLRADLPADTRVMGRTYRLVRKR